MRSAPPIAPGMPRMNGEAGDAGFLRGARDLARPAPRRRRARDRPSSTVTSLKPRPSRIATPGTPPSRTIRLEPRPITVTGISAGRLREEIREVVLVLRHEQHLRRPADAKPGELGAAAGWRAGGRAGRACRDFRSERCRANLPPNSSSASPARLVHVPARGCPNDEPSRHPSFERRDVDDLLPWDRAAGSTSHVLPYAESSSAFCSSVRSKSSGSGGSVSNTSSISS